MDALRLKKDRSYKNVFKGSVLVTTLLDHDQNRFTSRVHAVKFAQKLLDAGHIESIVGSGSFEDSVHLYRWADETVVREAKRMVSTNSSHIPKKKLIEMIDMGQGGEDPTTVKDMKERISHKQSDGTSNERRVRRRERSSRRKTLESNEQPKDLAVDAHLNQKSRDSDSNLTRTNSVSSSEGILGSDNTALRVASPPSVLSDKDSSILSTPVKFEPTQFREPRIRSPDTNLINRDSPVTKSTNSSRSQSRESGICSPERPQSRPKSPETLSLSRPLSPASTQNSRVSSPGVLHTLQAPVTDDNNNNTAELPATTTCTYDGVEMPALDLENVDFMSVRSDRVSASLSAMSQSIEDLVGQSGSYSDNEKQLMEQMKKMRLEHQTTVVRYEEQINDLMSKITELKIVGDRVEQGLTSSAGDGSLLLTDRFLGGESSTDGTISPPPVPPVPAPPPPPPPLGVISQKTVKPTKPAIKPRVKMRPLFWNRIILDHDEEKEKDDKDEAIKEKERDKTFWHNATEPNFDVDEFERLFGKSVDKESSRIKSLHDAIGSQAKGRFQAAKILDENRSRAVAIKLRSMHCQMDDIMTAVYQMDFNKIELESLWGLYEIRGKKEELEKIQNHMQTQEDVPLDQPEQFLVELSQMSHFPERMECMMLRKRFNETLFNIDQQLSTTKTAIDEIKINDATKSVMELVLAFGNYMNGGTQRGQADGYDLTILAKLRDVKSMDNHSNLLHHLVKVYTRDYEECAGRNEAVFKFPDPVVLFQAAQVSFIDVDAELTQLQHQLNTHGKKAEVVYLDTEPELLQPFKEKMDDFFESAEEMLRRQQKNLEDTQNRFIHIIRYLAVKDTTEQMTPDCFFGIWASFIEQYRHYWKLEQKRIARESFEKVQQRKKDRIKHSKRRKSVVEDGKSNLKQRFAQMRRKSEHVAHTVKKIRAQHSVGGESDDPMSDAGFMSEASEAPPITPPVQEERPRRRRRPPPLERPDFTSGQESDTTNGNLTDSSIASSVVPERRSGRESMAERMHRRRKSQVSMDPEIQINLKQRTRNEELQNGRNRDSTNHSPNEQVIQAQVNEVPGPIQQKVSMSERMHRRRRPQPITMEQGAETAFPAPPEPAETEMVAHPRRRPARQESAESIYANFHGEDHNSERPYTRPRSGSRGNIIDNGMMHDPNSGRQRSPRDLNNMQQQVNVNNANNQAANGGFGGINAGFVIKTRAKFNQTSQDDDSKLLNSQPIKKTSRSHSQPAVHHISNSNDMPPIRPNLQPQFQTHRLHASASSDLDQPREELQIDSTNFRDVLRKMSRSHPAVVYGENVGPPPPPHGTRRPQPPHARNSEGVAPAAAAVRSRSRDSRTAAPYH